MAIHRYEEINASELDVIKEIGSIGNGNAATALSSLLGVKVQMTLPSVKIMEFTAAQQLLGHPEDVVAAVLVEMSGEIEGIMLLILGRAFVNEVFRLLLSQEDQDITQLDELQKSALIECGNIMISNYINAMSTLANVNIHLSVPQITVNMLGGIMSLPIAIQGRNSDRIMMITGEFKVNGKELNSDMLLLPDMESLNVLMEKLGVD